MPAVIACQAKNTAFQSTHNNSIAAYIKRLLPVKALIADSFAKYTANADIIVYHANAKNHAGGVHGALACIVYQALSNPSVITQRLITKVIKFNIRKRNKYWYRILLCKVVSIIILLNFFSLTYLQSLPLDLCNTWHSRMAAVLK